jgi:RNA polymerase sigma factor (sigma-70 family)
VEPRGRAGCLNDMAVDSSWPVGTEPEVAAAPGGDGWDLDSIYRAQWAGLVRLGRLLTGSQQLGEEVAQDAFVGMIRTRRRVDSPSAYLRRSVVNLAINVGKQRSRERRYLSQHREEHCWPPELDTTWKALTVLSARQRAVVVLRYYEDLSEVEIAAVLGCRRGTVKSLASRALDRLREELS